MMQSWIPPSVDHFISSNQGAPIIRRLIEDVVADPNDHFTGGWLVYDGQIFKEYKSGGYRIFCVILNNNVVVALFGEHKDKNYVGGTYKGENKFPVRFNSTQLSTNDEEKNAIAAVLKIYGKNTMNSPYPIFTWDDD